VLGASCLGSEGFAQVFEVRAHLEVVEAAGCGSQAELTARVLRRSTRIRFVEPGPGVRRARAELRPAGSDLVASSLSLWTDDGRELVRRLRPARCTDALDALSLVLLVSLDPDAEVGAPGLEPAEPNAGTSSPSSPAAEAPPRPATAERRPANTEARTAADPAPVDEADEDRALVPSSGSGWLFRPFGGAFGSVRGGPAPYWMPGFGVFAGLSGPGFPSESVLRLSFSRHRRSGFEVEGGSAEFELDALRLELCPVGLRVGAVGVHGCLQGELGELEAWGSKTLEPRSAARPWRSVGVSGGAGFRPWRTLELSLSGGLDHPLVRDRFAFNPEVFHEVGSVGGWLSLGLGLSIP